MTSPFDYEPALPHDDPRHQRAAHFLTEEAAILDARLWDRWLELLTDDISYVMPVRVSTSRGTGYDSLADMAHFDEDRYSLEKRVQRLGSETAWTEDPPSRTRHIVTNIRTHPGVADDEISVRSSLLLFRSRGDDRPADYVCADRADALVETAGGLKLRRRVLSVEESVLRTQNLAIFL